MAKPKELYLPSCLLSDGYFLGEACSGQAAAAFGVLEGMAGDEDYIAPLAWRLAHAWPLSGTATQSLRFLEEHGDDLLRESAAQVVRLRLRHAGHFLDVYDHRLLAPPKEPSLRPTLPLVAENAKAVLTPQQQMRATQLHYLEQRRSAAWETQDRARGSRTLCQWQQQQQPVRPGNGIYRSVAERASAGTGVFLPRTHASKPEPRKTPDDRRDGQSNAMVSLQKWKSELVRPTSIVSRETHLPHEWTY